jgi:predicted O-methyltransferase YrrM
MAGPSASDRRLRIPGFRRYASELARLRAQLAELDSLRSQIASADRELRALRAGRGLAADAEATDVDAEWIARAKQYEYYWLNANKKLDLLALPDFGPLARRVLKEGRTFLNADRLYTLWQAARSMPEAATAAAEIGTFKGGSAKLLAEAMRASGRVRPFYVCDTFSGHAVVNEALDGRHRVGKQFTAVRAPRVISYLSEYEFLTVVEGDIQETAARLPADHRFGLVHIDVDVHPVTQFCLEFFAPRLAAGATIVVDDYGFTTCPGVKKAVDDFVAARRDEFHMMHLLTAQAVLTRLGPD